MSVAVSQVKLLFMQIQVLPVSKWNHNGIYHYYYSHFCLFTNQRTVLFIDLMPTHPFKCHTAFFQKWKIPNGIMRFQSTRSSTWLSCHFNTFFWGGVPIKETVGNYTKLKEVVQPQLSGLMVIYSGAEWRPLPLPCLMVTFRFINGPDEGSGRERLFPLSS